LSSTPGPAQLQANVEVLRSVAAWLRDARWAVQAARPTGAASIFIIDRMVV
jgi:hypothetical protein